MRDIKKAVSIPVIANGDITTPKRAKWVLEHTGADGIMIGRGAVGNPWIFHQIINGTDRVSSNLVREVVLEHFNQMLAYYGEFGAIIFRKHLHTYSKAGYQGASAFRNNINNTQNHKEMRELIDEFFSQELLGVEVK